MPGEAESAESTAKRAISRFTPELREKLVALRRELHCNPELSWKEEKTTARLADALSGTGPITRFARTGLVVRVAGLDPKAPIIAVRGDIDALPIHEETGLGFASTVPGVMHACGHDIHASWAVGAAHLLASEPAEGDVLVVLQPAEEIGEGAREVLASGVLDDVRAIFGGHVDRRFEVGQVVAQEGPLAASADMFEIELTGAGAHGARPHESRDPIVGAAALVSALQTLVSRRLDPALPGVVTIGIINAGTAPNVIPDCARISGTIRATTPTSRALLCDGLREMAAGVAASYGLAASVMLKGGSPPIINPADTVAWARTAVASLLGSDALVPLGTTNMGGEDFAVYMESIPGCFMRIGAREPGGKVVAAHSSHYYAAEGALFVGASVLAETARIASAALAHN